MLAPVCALFRRSAVCLPPRLPPCFDGPPCAASVCRPAPAVPPCAASVCRPFPAARLPHPPARPSCPARPPELPLRLPRGGGSAAWLRSPCRPGGFPLGRAARPPWSPRLRCSAAVELPPVVACPLCDAGPGAVVPSTRPSRWSPPACAARLLWSPGLRRPAAVEPRSASSGCCGAPARAARLLWSPPPVLARPPCVAGHGAVVPPRSPPVRAVVPTRSPSVRAVSPPCHPCPDGQEIRCR